MTTLREKNQLIPVDEALPPTNKYYFIGGELYEGLKISLPVVVLLDDGTYHIATLNRNCDEGTGEPTGEPYWFDENKVDEGDWLNKLVTHWMPLPQAPTEGD